MRGMRRQRYLDDDQFRDIFKNAIVSFVMMICLLSIVACASVLLTGCSVNRAVSNESDSMERNHYEATLVRSWEGAEDISTRLRRNDSLMHRYNIRLTWYDTSLPKNSTTGMHPVAATADIRGSVTDVSSEEDIGESHEENNGIEVEKESAEEDDETHLRRGSDNEVGCFSKSVMGLGYLATIVLLLLVFLNYIVNKVNKKN